MVFVTFNVLETTQKTDLVLEKFYCQRLKTDKYVSRVSERKGKTRLYVRIYVGKKGSD